MTHAKPTLNANNILTLAPHTDRKCPRLIADENGLYLQIMPSGSRSYIFRFTLRGRTRSMGLGPVRRITLSEARKRARELRVLVDQGTDPLAARQAAQAEEAAVVHRVTFQRCAELYVETHKVGWKSAKHADQWISTLTQYAYPVIGNMAVAEVGVAELKKILVPIWPTINETASRLRGRIEKVLGWATVQGFRSGENPARWSGYLSEIFPKRSLVREARHHSALPYAEAPEFTRELRTRRTMSAYLLEFVMLTAVRTTEARAAVWGEFDFEQALWVIPAVRMKAGREHRVPLSSPVLNLLRHLEGFREQLPESERSNFLFPSSNPSTCLSNMAMLAVLRKGMKRRDITPHGMRSTFRDWVAECTDFQREVAEAALAHVLQNKVEAAYQRGDFLEKRRALMEAWATFLIPSDTTARR